MMIVDGAYNAYLEREAGTRTHKDAELLLISGQMETALAAGTLTQDDLDEYEEKAAEAGFYAGFMAALKMFKELGGA